MMKFNKLLIIPIVVGAASLVGCSNESAKQVNLNLRYMTSDSAPATSNADAQAQMAQASSSVSRSLQRLSSVQMAKNPGVRMPKAIQSGGLSRIASLNWNGPVGPAVSRIASAAGYHFRVLGSAPAIPVIVTVNARHQSLGTILRNVTFQAAPTVTIRTYSRNRIIELRYNKK